MEDLTLYSEKANECLTTSFWQQIKKKMLTKNMINFL